MYTDNPLRDFERWDAEREKLLNRLPQCEDCGEPIQDERAYYIDGGWICCDCMDSYLRDVWPE